MSSPAHSTHARQASRSGTSTRGALNVGSLATSIFWTSRPLTIPRYWTWFIRWRLGKLRANCSLKRIMSYVWREGCTAVPQGGGLVGEGHAPGHGHDVVRPVPAGCHQRHWRSCQQTAGIQLTQVAAHEPSLAD